MSRSFTPGASQGVTTLMYVGDTPVASATPPSSSELQVGAVGLVAAIWGRGLLRIAGSAAAAYVGWKAYKAR